MKYRVGLCLGLGVRHSWSEPPEDVQPHHFFWRLFGEPIATRKHARLQPQREPDVGQLSAGFADEARRRDSNDRDGRAPDHQRLTEHVEAPSEPSLPVRVTDDRVRGLALVLGSSEQAANRWPYAQHLEECSGDKAPACFLRRSALDADLPGGQAALRGHQ